MQYRKKDRMNITFGKNKSFLYLIAIFLTINIVVVRNAEGQDLTGQTTTVITTLVPYEVADTTYPVIALDNNDNPHILVLYGQSWDICELRHIYSTGTNWIQKTLVSDIPWWRKTPPTIVFDKTNQIHTSCFRYDSVLKDEYVLYCGKPGIPTLVDTNAFNYSFRFIDVNSPNQPCLLYRDWNWGDLKLAQWNGFSWQIVVVSPFLAGNEDHYHNSASIKIDRNNCIHIISDRIVHKRVPYRMWDRYDLVYFYSTDGVTWQESVIDRDPEWSVYDINIGEDNLPYVVYSKYEESKGKYVLYYAKGPGWSKEIVVEGELDIGPMSLEFDVESKPHIFYIDYVYDPQLGESVNHYFHIWKKNGIWGKELLIKEFQETSNGVVDKKGNVHISFIDNDGNLNYLFRGKMEIPVDTLPPAKVTDLTIYDCSVTSGSVTLTWTAPGDDENTGQATTYDIRYSSSPILTDTDFDSATQVTGEPAPNLAGTKETSTIFGLEHGTKYYFALKTVDDAGNVSEMSNVVSARTLLDVPYFSQQDSRWKDELHLRSTWTTIGRVGCALTSMAMTVNYYADYHPEENMREKITKRDPLQLNTLLEANTWFAVQRNDIDFRQVRNVSNNAILMERVRHRDDPLLNESLNQKYPCILKLDNPVTGREHFVVAIGSCVGVGYKIKDPTSTNPPLETNTDLKKYNNKYKDIIIFKPDDGTGKASAISIKGYPGKRK